LHPDPVIFAVFVLSFLSTVFTRFYRFIAAFLYEMKITIDFTFYFPYNEYHIKVTERMFT